MAENKNTMREWSERLEVGKRDDELLEVAARLERAGRDEPSAPSVEFRRQLRRDLLNQYETAADKPARRLWRLAGSVAAVGLLAVIVIITWLSMSSAGRTIPGDAAVAGGAATPVNIAIAPWLSLPPGGTTTDMNIPTAPVPAASLGAYGISAPNGLAPGQPLEVTARWHIPAELGAAGAFAQIHNDAGQIVADASGPIQALGSEVYEFNLAIPLPDTLPDGSYTVLFGLLDAASARLPLYDLVNSAVIYEESSSPLVVGPAQPTGSEATEMPITPTPPLSGYTLLDYSVTGGIVTETMETDSGETQTQSLLVPGMTVEVVTRWSRPTDAGDMTAFVHLVQSGDAIVAQSDAPVSVEANSDGQAAEVTLTLVIPADLAPGEYQLVGGLYDMASGARLPFSTAEGEVTLVVMGEYVVSEGGDSNLDQMNEAVIELQDENQSLITLQPPNEAGNNLVTVIDVEPAAGTVVSGTAPIHFRITLSYSLDSLSSAFLEARVVEPAAGDGRQLGKATADLSGRNGALELEIVVDPTSTLYGLSGPADLGLEFEIRPDAAGEAIPFVIETPGDVHWRYEP